MRLCLVLLLGTVLCSGELERVRNEIRGFIESAPDNMVVLAAGTGTDDLRQFPCGKGSLFYLVRVKYPNPDSFDFFFLYRGVCVPLTKTTVSDIEKFKSNLSKDLKIPLASIEIFNSAQEQEISENLSWDRISFLCILATYLLGLILRSIFYFFSSKTRPRPSTILLQPAEEKEDSFENSILEPADDSLTSLDSNSTIRVLHCFNGLNALFVILCNLLFVFMNLPLRNTFRGWINLRLSEYQLVYSSFISYDFFIALVSFYFTYQISAVSNKFIFSALTLLCYYPLILSIYYLTYSTTQFINSGPISGILFNQEYSSCEQSITTVLTLLPDVCNISTESNYFFSCFNWLFPVAFLLKFQFIIACLAKCMAKTKLLGWSIITLFMSLLMVFEIFKLNAISYPVNTLLKMAKLEFFEEYNTSWLSLYFSAFSGVIAFYSFKYLDKRKKTKKERFVGSTVFLVVILCYFAISLPNMTSIKGGFKVLYNFVFKKIIILGLFIAFYKVSRGKESILHRLTYISLFPRISKFSLSLFLVNPLVMKIFFYGMKNSIYFNLSYLTVSFLTITVFSALLAPLLHLALVTPLVNLKNKMLSNNI